MYFYDATRPDLLFLPYVTGCDGLGLIAGFYALGLAGYTVVDTVTPDDDSK